MPGGLVPEPGRDSVRALGALAETQRPDAADTVGHHADYMVMSGGCGGAEFDDGPAVTVPVPDGLGRARFAVPDRTAHPDVLVTAGQDAAERAVAQGSRQAHDLVPVPAAPVHEHADLAGESEAPIADHGPDVLARRSARGRDRTCPWHRRPLPALAPGMEGRERDHPRPGRRAAERPDSGIAGRHGRLNENPSAGDFAGGPGCPAAVQ